MKAVCRFTLPWLVLTVAGPTLTAAQPERIVDLLQLDPAVDSLMRVHGSAGDGTFGVPVAGPFDCDGDGLRDVAFAAFLGSPLDRFHAGEVYLVFGSGAVAGTFDSAGFSPNVLKIAGQQPSETAGSEIWMDDITGDGIGDLIIARQSYTTSLGLIGAGAVSVVVGGPSLRAHAASLQLLDLTAPPENITVTTIAGAHPVDRLGIWMRTGDVTGDGIADLLAAADQENVDGNRHAGVSYLIRGGPHVAAGGEIDLGALAGTPLATQVARILPPRNAAEFHVGATCQIADLDNNRRAEVMVAAALNRAGASFEAENAPGQSHAVGGTTTGTLYILWDDNFGDGPWPEGFTVEIPAPAGTRSVIRGGPQNTKFGEEIIGGLDYNGDGRADLFIGDLTGDGSPASDRPNSGLGHIIFNAAALKGVNADLTALPLETAMTTFLGPATGDIAADTTVHGDFDDDGIADVAFSAPHANPAGRASAGIVYVFHGRPGPWPERVDLRDTSQLSELRLTEVWGARGRVGADDGDVLAYSASAGDLDFDGRSDLLINEMTGNGLQPGTEDVGNLIIIGAQLLGAGPACAPQPIEPCQRAAPLSSRVDLMRATDPSKSRLRWRWLARSGTSVESFRNPPGSLANYALCVYDSSAAAQPVAAATLLAGLDCIGGPCWQTSTAAGYRYRRDDRRPRGVESATLVAGAGGEARLAVRARGTSLSLPESPLVLPARVQLVISSGASFECWQAEYQAAFKNEAGRFVARTP
jgi:hypothetical protein